MYKPCTFFVLALAAFAFAAEERYPREPKPAQFAGQEGCYIGSLGLVVPSDRPYYPKGDQRCEVYKCNATDGETLRETCGAIAIVPKPGCRSVQDYTKDYPDCCLKEQCDGTTVAPTTEAPTTVAPTTAAPTTAAPTTAAPTTAAPTTEAAPSARAEANAGPGGSYATAYAPGAPAETTTTVAPTTEAPTTVAPTTAAPTTAASTTVAPTTPGPGQSYARASAKSESGKPPVTETFATPGAQAAASAT